MAIPIKPMGVCTTGKFATEITVNERGPEKLGFEDFGAAEKSTRLLRISSHATGKSTFYKDRNKESKFLELAVATQSRIVIDNTNPSRIDREKYLRLANENRYKVVGYYFQSKLDVSIARNNTRVGKEKISDAGLRGTYAKLEIPTFDEDAQMRVYETAQDRCVIPNMYMVARIDGRNFTKLSQETYKFEAPFDVKFRDLMVETVKHLMNCGFRVIYGYTESDEISLLFHYNEALFSRKHRKYNSILAGEASAKFSMQLGGMGVFDCRISELPSREIVMDYFRWRNEDAFRNALNAHCYWKLRGENLSKTDATKKTEKMSVADKNELLFSY
eukprot:gene39265-53085_t